jgi:hypothetical protein
MEKDRLHAFVFWDLMADYLLEKERRKKIKWKMGSWVSFTIRFTEINQIIFGQIMITFKYIVGVNARNLYDLTEARAFIV